MDVDNLEMHDGSALWMIERGRSVEHSWPGEGVSVFTSEPSFQINVGVYLKLIVSFITTACFLTQEEGKGEHKCDGLKSMSPAPPPVYNHVHCILYRVVFIAAPPTP